MTLKNFPPLNVTASLCAVLEMSFDYDNGKEQQQILSANSHYFQINILHILVPLKETPKTTGKSGTKRITNLCVIICKLEIRHRSEQGLP